MRGRPRQHDPLDDMPAPPVGYTGKWMTRAELRKANKELAKVGRRICTTHQGAALPLTAEFFYYNDRKKGYFRNDCKACADAVRVARHLERYRTEEAYRERTIHHCIRYDRVHADAKAQRCRDYRHRQKAERFAAIMEGKAS